MRKVRVVSVPDPKPDGPGRTRTDQWSHHQESSRTAEGQHPGKQTQVSVEFLNRAGDDQVAEAHFFGEVGGIPRVALVDSASWLAQIPPAVARFLNPHPALLGLLASAAASVAHAGLVITEVMPLSAHANTSVNGDWWELTNTGATAVNLSGYKWDDTPDAEEPTVSIFPNVTILAGESIIILEEALENVAAWRTAWGLSAAVRVVNRDQFSAMGGEGFSGLSGPNGDEVNLYDPSGSLVAHVSFGPTTAGRSRGFHRDGTPIYGLLSTSGKHGAKNSTQFPADTGSPGNTIIHFTSAPVMYGLGTYTYSLTAVNPGGSVPTISSTGLPSFLTLNPGPPGTATLSSNRSLTLADAGNYLLSLSATGGVSSTVQEFLLTILNPSPSMILNEYNAVSADNYLNGGTASVDSDGAPLAADSYFDRVLGNGGKWAEFVVTGNGGPERIDLRAWKIEIGKDQGTGFSVLNTLVFSQHPDWQAVPSGTILTLIERNTAQGGLNSGFAIRDRRGTLGDTWTNIWMGDPSYLTYSSVGVNGYSLVGGVVSGIEIDNNGTQFRIKNGSGQIVFGPVGEGVVPVTGISSEEVFELEDHPTPSISPIVGTTATTQGYDDSAPDSTFGEPNLWTTDAVTESQSFIPYAVGRSEGFAQWAEAHNLTGDDALWSADPDEDGRDNGGEYAFGGDPRVKDSAYPFDSFSSGAMVTWSYVRRSDDPDLTFRHESSEELLYWSPVTTISTVAGPYASDYSFSIVTVQFDHPVPAVPSWFLRAVAE